jgi:uncharacterized protein YdhG (YjbR/CyaY superfamily)
MSANVVDDYIRKQPEPARRTLKKLAAMIRATVPEGTTEGIAYGMPCFRCGAPLIGFAVFQKHWSLFPMSGGVIPRLERELAGFVTSKGAVHFPHEAAPSAGLLKKIIRVRLAEIKAKRS